MEDNQYTENLLPGGVVVYNRFVRSRNVLLSEVDCTELFKQVDLHRKQHTITVPDTIAPLFYQLLGAFTLHCASRPRNEMMAWTIRYAQPHVSFFFAGDTEVGSVIGRFFQQNVKEAELGEMHQELHRRGKEPHMSMVEFSGDTAQASIHQFYNVSEQRPARYFDLGNNRFALVSAHPDYDEGWFTHVDLETVLTIRERETVNLLETRPYYWLCGCSEQKIMDMLVPLVKKDPQAIFGEDSQAVVNCPRCNANYPIDRATMMQRIASMPEDSEPA